MLPFYFSCIHLLLRTVLIKKTGVIVIIIIIITLLLSFAIFVSGVIPPDAVV